MKAMLLAATALVTAYAGGQGTQIKTFVGRIVWGHPLKPQIKKQQDGPNKGQPVLKDGKQVEQWAFGVAFDKTQFAAQIWPSMQAEALTGYPNGVPPRFSWKYKDGDTVDSKGVPYSQREGHAGNIILTISTEAAAPTVVKLDPATNTYRQLTAEEIKPGDYVVCVLNFKVNVATGTNTPSLYVNPVLIEHVGYGPLIVSANAPDPMALLGGAQYQLPPGASAAPLAPVSPIAPPMPGGMPGAAPAAPMAPAPGGMMPGMPAAAPMAPAPVTPPPPPPVAAPAGPQRPTDPSHIAPNPAGGEFWWINGQWTPGVAAPAAPTMPPPAPDFVANAGMPAPVAPAPGGMPGMPGMMPGR